MYLLTWSLPNYFPLLYKGRHTSSLQADQNNIRGHKPRHQPRQEPRCSHPIGRLHHYSSLLFLLYFFIGPLLLVSLQSGCVVASGMLRLELRSYPKNPTNYTAAVLLQLTCCSLRCKEVEIFNKTDVVWKKCCKDIVISVPIFVFCCPTAQPIGYDDCPPIIVPVTPICQSFLQLFISMKLFYVLLSSTFFHHHHLLNHTL